MICSIEFLEENDWTWRRLDRFLMLFGNNEWLLRYSPADNGYIPNKSRKLRCEDFFSNHSQMRSRLANHFAQVLYLCVGNIASLLMGVIPVKNKAMIRTIVHN